MRPSSESGLPHFGGVALAGFMGAGKSTVGARLAERLGWPWLDLDCRIEEGAGRSIPELFAVHGEAGFREIELATLSASVQRAQGPCVWSLGGGALLDARATELLAQAGVGVVVLGVSLEEARARTQGSGRPLGHLMGELHAARADHYAGLGPVIDTDHLSPAAVVDAVMELL